MFLYTVVVITVVSVLVNKSPEHLIVGLSAFAAVLLLIFKDSILGFVAGIQLTSNNMIRIGDWIQMDKNNAKWSCVGSESVHRQSAELGYDYFDGTHLSVGVGIFHQLAGNAGIAGTENYAEYQYRYRFGSFFES